MLFINDPDAFRAIVEERRRDDGQRLATITDVRPQAPTLRDAGNGPRPRYRVEPIAVR